MRVCLGGTFNIFHDGHKKLFDKAMELAGDDGSIHIGITTGDVIKSKKNVNSFDYRRKVIFDYISRKKMETKIEILPIDTKFGFAVDKDFDIIIVSPETKFNALEINYKRKELGKKPLDVIEIPYVLADDGKPISSTRIINKEIDNEGQLI